MQKLFHNGVIVTMENISDSFDAVLIDDNLIKAVGNFEALNDIKSDSCEMIDLKGNTLMPSFIDGHGHISVAGEQYYTKVDLESAKNFSDIVFLLKKFIDENQIPAGEPVSGFAYDHNYLEEGRHPDKKILDQASAVHPIVISHTSGHVGVANSLALARAKVDNATEEIQGGVIERYPNTDEPSGYLEETALMMVKQLNEPIVSNPVDVFAKVQELYAANGVTTAQDGASHREGIKIMRKAGQQGKLYIDIVAYPIPFGLSTEDEFNRMVDENKDIFGQYVNHVKIGGYKAVLDGSPQGKSAWMSAPYENSGDYCGYPWYTDDQLHATIRRALNDNQQFLAHCNGDAASEQFLNIYESELDASNNPNKHNLRPVMIHCQTVRDDQLDRMQALNMIPSIFVAHTWYWGEVHLKNFGKERGSRVSPCKSALDRDLIFNLHTDTPVRLPKMLHSVWAAVNRRTQNGVTIGPEQRIDVYNALKGITINSAYAYFEEDSKGSIKVGKRADLVILDRNPLKVDPMEIQDIQVLETIKDGTTIYRKE